MWARGTQGEARFARTRLYRSKLQVTAVSHPNLDLPLGAVGCIYAVRDVRAHTPNEVARAASYVEEELSKDAIGLLSEVELACCCDTRWRSKSPTT